MDIDIINGGERENLATYWDPTEVALRKARTASVSRLCAELQRESGAPTGSPFDPEPLDGLLAEVS